MASNQQKLEETGRRLPKNLRKWEPRPAHVLIQTGFVFFFFFFLAVSLLWLHPQPVEVLGPGIEPAPQQGPELLQRQHQVPSPLPHQGTP